MQRTTGRTQREIVYMTRRCEKMVASCNTEQLVVAEEYINLAQRELLHKGVSDLEDYTFRIDMDYVIRRKEIELNKCT